MFIWINSYLPQEDVKVEILINNDVKEKAVIEFVYDMDLDPNSNTPKWWVERLKLSIELREVVAWRHCV